MKIHCAENLRHWLGDLREDRDIFAMVDDGFYEVTDVVEQGGHVVLTLGDYHHALPTEASK